jgi:hypothetical protein
MDNTNSATDPKLTFTGVTVIDLDLIKSITPAESYSFEKGDPHYYLGGVERPDHTFLSVEVMRAGFFARVPATALAPILFPEVK